MAKKKEETVERIPIEEIEEGATYKTYVNDIVVVRKINKQRKEVIIYNASGDHKQ